MHGINDNEKPIGHQNKYREFSDMLLIYNIAVLCRYHDYCKRKDWSIISELGAQEVSVFSIDWWLG